VNDSQAWTENRASGGALPLPGIHELAQYRDVVSILALRDLKVRYKQTFFGVAWALLQPLLVAAIFTLMLGRYAGVPSDGLPYSLFVLGGFVLWTYLSQSVMEAAASLVDNESLVSKIYLPRILAPFAAVLPYLLDLALSLPLVFGLMFLLGLTPGPALLLLPLWIFAAALLAFAVGAFLAALNVKYRDVREALPFMVQIWLFASPVLYPSSLTEGAVRWIYAANPAVGLLDGFRWSVIDGPAPPTQDLASLAVGAAFLLCGLWYFRRTERQFADHI
jgi:ABC-type polysaccharide/polyol phosphate export permease